MFTLFGIPVIRRRRPGLNAVQLSEWEAYDRLDPIGSWTDDFRMARLMSLIINIVRSLYPKKGHKPEMVTPVEFMPNWLGEEQETIVKQQDPEEMKQMFQAIVRAQNKKKALHNNPPSKLTNKEKK